MALKKKEALIEALLLILESFKCSFEFSNIEGLNMF